MVAKHYRVIKPIPHKDRYSGQTLHIPIDTDIILYGDRITVNGGLISETNYKIISDIILDKKKNKEYLMEIIHR